jgi:uncharacterized DUF497 family protein
MGITSHEAEATSLNPSPLLREHVKKKKKKKRSFTLSKFQRMSYLRIWLAVFCAHRTEAKFVRFGCQVPTLENLTQK